MTKSLSQSAHSSLQLFDLAKLGEWSQTETSTRIADAIAHFLLTLRSPHTRRNYGRDIKEFLDFAGHVQAPVADLKDITEKLVLLWNENLLRQHALSDDARRRVVYTSIARKLCSLSSLLEFAKQRQLIDDNVLDRIPRPKIKRTSKTNALTYDEVQAILALLEQKRNSVAQLQPLQVRSAYLWHTVFATLFTVGMRVDELCELRIADLEETATFARLHMTAKGGEVHSPIIHPKTLSILKQYISHCRPHASPNALLFVRAQSTSAEAKLTQSAVYQMLQKTAQEAGIEKHISPHSCRATLATLLHKQGVPIGQIQDLLNHKQITTTAIYLKKADEMEDAAALKIDLLGT